MVKSSKSYFSYLKTIRELESLIVEIDAEKVREAYLL